MAGRLQWVLHALRPARSWSEGWSVTLAGLDAASCKHRFELVVIDAARLARLLSLQRMGECCFRAPDAPQHFRFSRFRLKVDQRTLHGPHRCALSLKRAAVAWRSVAHATHGWHCCSPERRGPEGTQVTRAVEKCSQRSLSLLVCAAGHLWPPHGARRIVHAPRVRRPSPLKAREAAQG